jgi:HlyD family secretion protein
MAENTHDKSTERRRRRWLTAAGVIVIVVVLAAFISMGGKQVPVRVEMAVRATITSTISTNGKIEPMDNFEAHAPAPTTVRQVLVHEGDRVKAGQLLVQLDAASARADAAKAEAQLKAAQADVHAVQAGGTHEEVLTTQAQLVKAQAEVDAGQRNLQALQRLQQKGAASAGEVEAAQNRLRAAQADLKLLQQKQTNRFSGAEVQKVQAQAEEARAAYAAAMDLLTHSEIRAPRAGTVYSLPVRAGQYVNAGDLIVQVANLSTVEVRAFVDEPDIGRLHQGQAVQVTWDAMPGRVWQGELKTVPSTVVTVGSRNVGQVTVDVDNSDLSLLPNVNVSVNIITAKDENALTVPREAVHQEDGHRFVYQVVNGQLQRRDVTTSIANLTRIEVTHGLPDNVEVALGAINGKPLQNGMSVRVIR